MVFRTIGIYVIISTFYVFLRKPPVSSMLLSLPPISLSSHSSITVYRLGAYPPTVVCVYVCVSVCLSVTPTPSPSEAAFTRVRLEIIFRSTFMPPQHRRCTLQPVTVSEVVYRVNAPYELFGTLTSHGLLAVMTSLPWRLE